MSHRLVGIIPVPLPVQEFTTLAAAYASVFPGCTVAGSAELDVRIGSMAWRIDGVPVFAELDETPPPDPNPEGQWQ